MAGWSKDVPIECTSTAHQKRVPIGLIPAFWYMCGKKPIGTNIFYSANTGDRSMVQSSKTFTFIVSSAVPKSLAT